MRKLFFSLRLNAVNNTFNNTFLRQRSIFRTDHAFRALATESKHDGTVGSASAAVTSSRVCSLSSDFWSRIKKIYDEDIAPLNEAATGPVEKYSSQITRLPFVFCIGNHSSGKSSFINHLLGREIQHTGVAPTDDCFTVVAPGPRDADQDGRSLVGDPDFGFSGMKRYGRHLLNHLVLKVRKDTTLQDIMVLDSPGMIDNPAPRSSAVNISNTKDRGYDFPAVTKWLANRADVVLLFFDPDKPGTTGETLQCMTKALIGVEHKLHIILNKADKFEKMHDFARAYGALCWNLSKVIPRKDLPKIYTMCVPVDNKPSSTAIGDVLDLEQAREDVIREVMMAPERRIDNSITWLDDSTKLLEMHMRIINSVYKKRRSVLMRHWGTSVAFGALGQALAGAALALGQLELAVVTGSMSVLLAGVVHVVNTPRVNKTIQKLISDDGLYLILKKEYHAEAVSGDEFVTSLWYRVREPIQTAIQTVGIENLSSITATRAQMARLREICDKDVPQLRREAAPHTNETQLGV